MLLHPVLSTKNGHSIIVSEQFTKEIEQYYDPQTQAVSYTDVFHYDNVTITYIDTNSKLINEYTLLKNQLSSNDGGIYSSFTTMVLGDTLTLFYNDNPKNLTPKDKPKLARTSSFFTEPIQTNYNQNGFISSKKVDESVGINLVPKSCYQLKYDSPSYLILEQNKRNQLIRISH